MAIIVMETMVILKMTLAVLLIMVEIMTVVIN